MNLAHTIKISVNEELAERPMNLEECRTLAERVHPAKTHFVLTTPSGNYKAEWLDPFLGLFIVPAIGSGTVSLRDMRGVKHNCSTLEVVPQATP